MEKRWYHGGSGPVCANAYHRMLACAFLVAWLSLGSQIVRLIGSRGLLPADELLWFGASDGLLVAGTWLGVGLAALALFGVAPRACLAVSTILYFGYAEACGPFLSFQWDNMLIELGFLAVFLPADRRRFWVHLLFRAFLFKLYLESGIAKWRSPLHDWIDGTAMDLYYETAPIPTALGWYMHHLPDWWHQLESWVVLVLELVVPFGLFGPRRLRLFAFVALGAFQLVNVATANYTFFAYLTLMTHVFLLDDGDLDRLGGWLGARVPGRVRDFGRWFASPKVPPVRLPDARWLREARRWGAGAVVVCYAVFSLLEGAAYFTVPRYHTFESLYWLHDLYRPYRVFNRYHLFAGITTERNEPEIQTLEGREWTPQHLHYKPGPLSRPPPFVAPHQPRLDFLLWFYGIYYRHPTPQYVRTLFDRICHDPDAVQGFFPKPLPERPRAVKIVFWRYRYTTPDERAETGHWWKRSYLDETSPVVCSSP